jgi:hypothetical protein
VKKFKIKIFYYLIYNKMPRKKEVTSEPEKVEPVTVVVKNRITKKSPYGRDAQGNRLTKTGKIDKRQFFKGNENFKKVNTTVSEALKKAKQRRQVLKEKALSSVTAPPESESDSDEASEYEVEELVVKKKGEPQVVEVEKVVEKVVEKIVPDERVVEELKIVKEQKQKLQESFVFNDHLTRISGMAKQMSIKW